MNNKLTLGGVLFSVFIFVLPFFVFRGVFYPAVNAKYFFIITFVVVYSLYFITLLLKNKIYLSFKGRWLLFLSAIVLIVYYLSAYLGVDFSRSLWSDIVRSTGLYFISCIALLAFFSGETLNKKDWDFIRKSIIISSSIFSVLLYLGPFGFGISNFFFQSTGIFLGNETFAGAYLLISIIITFIEIFESKKYSNSRKFFILLAIIQITSPLFINFKALFFNFSSIISNPILILGGARASAATLILFLFYLFGFVLIRRFFSNYKKKLLPIWIISFILIVSTMVGLLFVQGSFIQEKYIESSTAARIIVWNSSFEAFNEKPLLGWGPENFRMAFYKHLDNKLYLSENIGEVWFDKAHNIIIDNLVTVGLVGVFFTIILILWFVSVVIRSRKLNLISLNEAYLLAVLPFFHILQLQTSFETPSTYMLIAIILGYGFWLEKEIIKLNTNYKNINKYAQKGVAIIVLVLAFLITRTILFDEFSRQVSLFNIFTSQSNEEQKNNINKAFNKRIDMEGLRLSYNSVIKGAFAQMTGNEDPVSVQKIQNITLEQLSLYESFFNKFLEKTPDEYRIRMNYAHLLMNKTVLGEKRIDEAKEIISSSYHLSPSNPLTYIMDSVASLYGGDLKESKEKIDAGIALEPRIKFTQQVLEYIKQQEKKFPKIGLIEIENL